MAGTNPATQKKRQRELSQRENRQAKLEKAAQRKEEKRAREANPHFDSSVDPDLVGIFPGPHNNDRVY